MGLEKLAEALPKSNRGGEWIAMCGFYDGKRFISTKGIVRGVMAHKARGSDGWGFDPWFIPNGLDKTYAEMGPKEKLKFSARKKALVKLRQKLIPANFIE